MRRQHIVLLAHLTWRSTASAPKMLESHPRARAGERARRGSLSKTPPTILLNACWGEEEEEKEGGW